MHRAQRPHLESLDQRLVPSATVLDLTHAGDEKTAPNGAIVQQCDAQPTGTGYIRAFVRVQGAAPGGGTEQGYNTDGRPLQFDENSSPQFTRSLTLGQVPTVTVNGVEYREFLLDINQKSSSPLLSLDEVRVFLGDSGNLTNYDVTAKTLNNQSAVFDLDSGGDVSVMLNYRLNAGSGAGDMYLLIPNSAFANGTANSFVYLYSKFGGATGASANAGFEEWAVRAVPPTQPPPLATGSISGSVLLQFEGTATGLGGITIQLQGTDYLGNTVVKVATTNLDGSYTFTDVAPGTYSLIQILPPQYEVFTETAGTGGGTEGAVDGRIDQILLNPNDTLSNYVFFNVFKT